MKQNFIYLIVIIWLLAFVNTANAQTKDVTILLEEEFTSSSQPAGWAQIDGQRGDPYEMDTHPWTFPGGYMNFPYSTTSWSSGSSYADTWAFTPDITMEAGETYTIEIKHKLPEYSPGVPPYFPANPGHMKVWVAQGQSYSVQEAGTNLFDSGNGEDDDGLRNADWLVVSYDYTCLADGDYNFGIQQRNCINCGWTMSTFQIDYVKITTEATVTLPLATTIQATDTEICNGNETTISVTPSGGVEPYFYVWSYGSGEEFTASPTETTTYSVTISDSSDPVQEISTDISIIVNNVPVQASTPTGEQNLCINSDNTDYSTSATGANSYIWEITPVEAGTVTGTTATATVNWNDTFTGEANISVTPENDCGQGTISESLTVSINNGPEQATTPTGEQNLCINSDNTDYSTSATGANSYTWEISPAEAGIITGTTATATIDWNDTFTGEVSISASPINDCGTGTTSEILIVTIHDSPVSDFSYIVDGFTVTLTNNSQNASSYLWNFGDTNTSDEFEPVHTYAENGEYTISLNAQNEYCDDNISSNTLTIEVTNINSYINKNIKIYPTVSFGVLNIDNARDETIIITNIVGKIILKQRINSNNEIIDISGKSSGVYFISILNSNKAYKIIIQ